MKLEEKLAELKKRNQLAEEGGGAKRRERQHKEGKMSARERIEFLLDEGTFEETDKLVTHRSYDFGMQEQKYYGDGNLYTLIAAANKLANPDLIRVGDVLIIPPRPTPAGPPETYVVQPGDTLWGIAEQRYGDPNKYRLIAEANHLSKENA